MLWDVSNARLYACVPTTRPSLGVGVVSGYEKYVETLPYQDSTSISGIFNKIFMFSMGFS